MRRAFVAFSRLLLVVALLGAASPCGPNPYDLSFIDGEQTFAYGQALDLPAKLINDSYQRISYDCTGIGPRIFVAVVSDGGRRLATPPRPPITITRCTSGDHGGLDHGRVRDFDLPLEYFGYRLAPGAYTVYAALDDTLAGSLDDASSTHIVVSNGK